MEHLDTDMTLAKMAEVAYSYKSIKTDDIKILSLNNECVSLKQCHVGAYLYTPSRDLFGGASVIIPENARINKLSYYDDIRRFVDVTFRFPNLSESPDEIVIVSSKANIKKAQNLGISLSKMGMHVSSRYPHIIATGSIAQSHVNIYWHPDIEVGINPKSPTIEALKYLEEGLPYIIVPHNEYISTDGPKIEIVLGDDMDSYFPFIAPVYYIPTPPAVSGETNNSSKSSSGIQKNTQSSTNAPKTNTTPSTNTRPSATVIESVTSDTTIQP